MTHLWEGHDIDPGPRVMSVFLDESGSTGDVAITGADLGFGGQPIFVLAAIGTPDPDILVDWLTALSAKHGIKAGEVKSTDLVGLPAYAADLASLLAHSDFPVFIEVVDKRYLLVVNLVNHVILPLLPGYDEGPGGTGLRPIMVELIHETIPDHVLRVYADACITPTSQGVGAVFTALTKWVTRHPMEGVRETLVQLVAESAQDWRSDGPVDAHLRWLPAPDPSVTGRSIWMLPGLSSLTNIYARLNLYRRGRLADVRLVHDEHMLYGCILQDAKRLMEELAAADAVPMVPHADYALREHAELEFRSSADTPGIQAADVIGGFVMRYARDALAGRSPSRDRVAAMARILALSRPEEARGLNFVTSGRLMAAMGVPWV